MKYLFFDIECSNCLQQTGKIYSALNNYIINWQRLLRRYCDKQNEMLKISPDGTNGIARALICLDVLFISTETEWKAVLLPLHPLYLWRYFEIFNKVFQQASVIADLSAEDKDCLAKALAELPNLVNFIIVDKTITEGQDMPLPNSGSYEMLPTFENKTNRYLGNDGIEHIKELLERWINFAPYTQNELRFAIVDAPDLTEVIRIVKSFLHRKYFIYWSARC